MSHFEFWFCDQLGNRVSHISTMGSFSYVKTWGDIGILSLSTPLQGATHEQVLPDYRVHVYRRPYGGNQKLEMICFLDKFSFQTSAQGVETVSLGGQDFNTMLGRRIVDQHSGASGSTFDGTYVSNQMTLLARRTIGTSTTAGRDLSDYGVTVNSSSGDIDRGGAIEKNAAWKNALGVLQDFQQVSKENGDEVFFGIIPNTPKEAYFRALGDQPGSDRSITSSNPVLFSLQYGNLLNPSLIHDYSSESNYIYAGGQGQKEDRIIAESEDTAATGRSPFARKEKFVNVTNLKTSAAVTDAANQNISKHRGKVILKGTLISTPSTSYGVHWNHGDKVTVSFQGTELNTIIRSVLVSVDSQGRERIQARIEETT